MTTASAPWPTTCSQPDSPIRRLYEWPPLLRLLTDVLGRGEIHPYADPLGALNLASHGRGRPAPVALRPDRLRGVAGPARRRRRRRLRGGPPGAQRGRRALRRRGPGPGRRHQRGGDAAHDPGHAAHLRGPPLDPPGEPHLRNHHPAGRPLRLRHATRHHEQRAVEAGALRPERAGRPHRDRRGAGGLGADLGVDAHPGARPGAGEGGCRPGQPRRRRDRCIDGGGHRSRRRRSRRRYP